MKTIKVPALDGLARRTAKLSALLDVAKAMTAQRDVATLIKFVANETRSVVDADRCTVWLMDHDRNELYTYVAQGLEESDEIRIPADRGIVGHVAQTGEILNIPDAYNDPRFNPAVDKNTGYRTKTILAVPMFDVERNVFGVLQVLNRRDEAPFDDEDAELLVAFGGQAASSLQNAALYQEIQRLFEGFITASVYAIEARDPTTSGHSERVAMLCVSLAHSLQDHGKGQWKGVRFSDEQIRELRYAALLHDFGKVGVREEVLVKAKKLYPHHLQRVKDRMDFVRQQLELETVKKKLEAVMRLGPDGAADALAAQDAMLEKSFEELDEIQSFVQQCNRPTVLEKGGFERLQEVAQWTFKSLTGEELPLLTPEEVSVLSIPRGSLSPDERREIESHVEHTFKFLSRIPWSRNLRRVPEIAYGHHEKLNGKGYPRGVTGDQLSVETRIMTVSDIYDALTASDRPYKKAVPHQKALDILASEADRGLLDQDILDVFIEARAFEVLPTV